MNFLAHIFLSGSDELRVVGNFIGDFVKGQKWREYPEKVQEGILLHRFIDGYTDKHTLVLQSIARLKPVVGRFAGIVVDVLYDYCLAQNFAQYSPTPLPAFAQNSYQILENHYPTLPTKVQELLPIMRRDDWLTHYATTYGITKALQGLTKRLNYLQDLTLAIPVFEKEYDVFEAEFLAFFEDIRTAVAEYVFPKNTI